jgi:hypothetical protein
VRDSCATSRPNGAHPAREGGSGARQNRAGRRPVRVGLDHTGLPTRGARAAAFRPGSHLDCPVGISRSERSSQYRRSRPVDSSWRSRTADASCRTGRRSRDHIADSVRAPRGVGGPSPTTGSRAVSGQQGVSIWRCSLRRFPQLGLVVQKRASVPRRASLATRSTTGRYTVGNYGPNDPAGIQPRTQPNDRSAATLRVETRVRCRSSHA